MKQILLASILLLALSCSKEKSSNFPPIPYQVSTKMGIGIGGDEPVSIAVYPTPFIGDVRIYVEVNEVSSISISFTNPDGDFQRVVDKYVADAGEDVQFQLDFRRHKAGVYLCEVVVNNTVRRFQLIQAKSL